MAEIETNFETVSKRYPEHVKEILRKKAKSKSRSKDVPPEKMRWVFSWYSEIFGPGKPQIHHASVAGKAGRGFWTYPLDEVPQEILDHYKKEKEENEKQRERFSKLTPEQQQAEIGGLLRELSGMGTIGVYGSFQRPL